MTSQLTLVALIAFAVGATAASLITYAACTLYRERHYWRLEKYTKSKYSRDDKVKGIV